MTPTQPGRRPIATRNARWVQALARWLTARGVTPNRISQSSILFALLAGLCFGLSDQWAPPAMMGLAAVFIQLRLLANLLDGLVAVEGGRKTPDGAFWNEVPDRAADILILTGAGIAAGSLALGLVAALGAVMTAYLRAIGAALCAREDFSGPMAKQHRMAVVTLAALFGAVESMTAGSGWALTVGLAIVIAGCAFTTWRRARTILARLASDSGA